ncbi:hypothetical protein JTB14_019016 [Gonioctena quinquepunctata]|nr:hypothetical protein JTB14_019016 [Gonioctena quinquepunctata]
MEEMLEVGLWGDADDDEIEMIIMDNILIDRDHVQQGQNPFNSDDYTDEEIVINFRFERADLPVLFEVLRIPEDVITETGNKVNGFHSTLHTVKTTGVSKSAVRISSNV